MKSFLYFSLLTLLFSCSSGKIPDQNESYFDTNNFDSIKNTADTPKRENVAPPANEGEVEIKRTITHKDSCVFSYGTYSEFEFKNLSLLNKIRNIAFGNYIGKTVNDFLYNDSIVNYPHCYWISEPKGYLKYLQLEFAKGLYVNVYAEKLKYIKQYNKDEKWDWKLFLKEKITKIEVEIE